MPQGSRPSIWSWLAALLAAVVLAVALGACGSSVSPPATAAARLVPADALAYINLSIDPGRSTDKQALRLADKLPTFPLGAAAIEQRLAALAGSGAGADFSRDIAPWLGHEAALALLNTPTSTASTLLLVSVRDRSTAARFLQRSGETSAGHYRSVPLLHFSSGTDAAFLGGFLVLGQDASVRAAIDVSAGAAGSLAASSVYRRAARSEPADRVLDVYASATGLRQLLGPQSGVAATLGVLLYQPALAGVTLSLSPASGGAKVRIHSVLDPSLASVSPSRSPSFSPTLQNVIPAGAVVMMDVPDLGRVAPDLLAAGEAGNVAGGVASLLSRLGAALQSEGVDVKQVLQLFSGETAVAITVADRRPALLIVSRIKDEQQVDAELASLTIPLQQLFPTASSGGGEAGGFNDVTVGGVTVHELTLEPGVELDYAVEHGLLVVSTGTQAIAAVAKGAGALAGESGYKTALAGVPSRVTSLVFLDFSQLLSLGDQTGLTKSAQFDALRPDLERIRAVGLGSTSGEAESTAELFLQIS